MATNAAPEPTPSVGTSAIVPAEPARPRKLSEEFDLILREFEVENVTLREVMALLHGRGFVLLVMLLALPFCTPIPLPGLSTPLGFIILLIGARLAMGAKPWLPRRLLDTRLPPAVFKKVFVVTKKIMSWFERLLKPRMLWLTESPLLLQLHAVPIVICAALLLLPLPIPFSNTFPAWAILLIAGGLLERDGRFIVAGYGGTIVAIAYIALFPVIGKQAFDFIRQWFER